MIISNVMAKNDSDRSWEALARIDPYYAVLTEQRYRAGNDAEEFFSSGEAHIDHVFKNLRRLNNSFRPRHSVDFGCGVGRLLIPLAHASAEVTGVDVSETMLAVAENNMRNRNIGNVRLVRSDDTLSALPAGFEFVHSVIVFQHIPVRRGEALFSTLLDKLAAGGMGAVHFLYFRNAPLWRKFVVRMGTYSSLVHGIANLVRGHKFTHPRMQMNHYSLVRLMRILYDHRCTDVLTELSYHTGTYGAMLYFRKSPFV